MTHQIILHDFTSGGCKMALHNAVPSAPPPQYYLGYVYNMLVPSL